MAGAVPAGAQGFAPPAIATAEATEAALAADAALYAVHYAVTPTEALARLRAQIATIPVTNRIAAEQRDRLAGIAIEHRPAFRIVILLTGTAPVAGEIVSAGGMAVPIVYRTGAAATHAQLLAAIETRQAALRAALAVPPGIAIDQREGGLVLAVNRADADRIGLQALGADAAALAGVPVRAMVPGREDADFAAGGGRLLHVDGASRRWMACTSGFVVGDGARTGLMTAAHCPDEMMAVEADGTRTPLAFVGQWGARFQDVQIHASAVPLAPLFRAGDAAAPLRPVTAARGRADLRAGDFVCHQGEKTGHSCAEILWPDYAPPGDLCGGPCTPTWVAVDGPDCDHGDSGGPVFTGTVALGILKGGSYRADGRCNFYYFMSIDYLPPGWSLMIAPSMAVPGPAIPVAAPAAIPAVSPADGPAPTP